MTGNQEILTNPPNPGVSIFCDNTSIQYTDYFYLQVLLCNLPKISTHASHCSVPTKSQVQPAHGRNSNICGQNKEGIPLECFILYTLEEYLFMKYPFNKDLGKAQNEPIKNNLRSGHCSTLG